MQNINSDYETWDKKRLIIGLFIFLIFIGILLGVKSFFLGSKDYFLDKKTLGEQYRVKKEEGSDLHISVPGPLDFQQKLNGIKEEVDSIDIAEIASSSPQIQKVISDLKNLQNLPENQAKEACYNICKSL